MRNCTDPREEYAPGFDVEIHQVVRNAALEVPMNLTDRHLAPNVLDSEVGEIRFGDCLIDCFVFHDSSQEIAPGLVA